MDFGEVTQKCTSAHTRWAGLWAQKPRHTRTSPVGLGHTGTNKEMFYRFIRAWCTAFVYCRLPPRFARCALRVARCALLLVACCTLLRLRFVVRCALRVARCALLGTSPAAFSLKSSEAGGAMSGPHQAGKPLHNHNQARFVCCELRVQIHSQALELRH